MRWRSREQALAGVGPAIDYIAELRQADDLATLPVGRKVIVIGGGNTAIDIAVQTKRLGAEDVTICYRRGPDEMGATWHEQEVAQNSGVKIKHWVRPVRLNGENGHVSSVSSWNTPVSTTGGRLTGTGDTAILPADTVFTAIGQVLIRRSPGGWLKRAARYPTDGRIAVERGSSDLAIRRVRRRRLHRRAGPDRASGGRRQGRRALD